jgi:hypothetical protein
MLLIFIFVVGIAVALIRRRLLAAPGDPTYSQDVPARLLGWGVGLLTTQREQWGQAMIGELDHIDGQARRWRFALGCVGAAVVMPPWGPVVAALGALMAVAASAAGLTLYTQVHYRLGVTGWTWAGASILVVILVCYILGGSALLRRPGVAGPGLVGGLLVAAAWLVVGGFTFNRWLNSLGADRWLVFLAPVVVGVGGTLWGGSAAIGRRAARLATVVAALSIYLYGVLAVAVLGAGGHDPSDGWTTAQVVSDNLGNQVVFYLMALPLMTASIGWAAAAATARLRYGPATIAAGPASLLITSSPQPAPTGVPSATPESPATRDGRPVPTQPDPRNGAFNVTPAKLSSQRRTWYYLVLSAALAASVFLVFFTFLSPR